jgi:hypothetical protein
MRSRARACFPDPRLRESCRSSRSTWWGSCQFVERLAEREEPTWTRAASSCLVAALWMKARGLFAGESTSGLSRGSGGRAGAAARGVLADQGRGGGSLNGLRGATGTSAPAGARTAWRAAAQQDPEALAAVMGARRGATGGLGASRAAPPVFRFRAVSGRARRRCETISTTRWLAVARRAGGRALALELRRVARSRRAGGPSRRPLPGRPREGRWKCGARSA